MSHAVVSATALARNFSEFLNRVRYQGVTLDVTRGNDVIACISPPSRSGGFPIADLDRLFASLPVWNQQEALQFERDIAVAANQLHPESDPWAS